MALVVNEISIANEQTGVFLDTGIKVTFNKAINPDSLTDANVHLYITTNNEVSGTHTVVASHTTTIPEVVEFLPQTDLTPNTKYIFFIAGDHNIADSVIQGISAADNDTMSGNFYITFTTGTEIGDPDLETPVVYNTDSTGDSASTSTPSFGVIDTEPYNGESQLLSVDELVLKFNTPLTDVDAINVRVVVEKATWPFVTTDPLYSSGYLVGSGYFNANKTEYHVPVDQTYQTLVNNHVYGVYADSVGSFSGHQWFFMSKLWPAYADIRQVRAATGNVFDDIPDALIWLKIHENSLYYTSKTGISYATEFEVPYEVNKWVVCKTIVDLYNLIKGVNKTPGNIIRKTLGDLTIEYSSFAKMVDTTVPEQFLICAELNWDAINTSNGPNHTVKSGQTYYYPGRNRRF